MSEYTPALGMTWASLGAIIRRSYLSNYGGDLEALRAAEFDAWLAEVELTAAEKAWDEGAEHGASTKCKYRISDEDPCEENPYRREEA